MGRLRLRMGQVGGWFPPARSEDIGLSLVPTVSGSGCCPGASQDISSSRPQHGDNLAECEDDDLLQVEVGGLHLPPGLELLQLVYNAQTSEK